jgi:NAD(P)-dependent dehydrogenase (short-subunit alcohol dehydrogenase family)
MIAGATGGIGSAVARRFAAGGYRLSLGARHPRKLGTWADREDVRVFDYDVVRAGAEYSWVEGTLSAFGRIDALINCAGILRSVTFDEGGEEDLSELFEVNVKGPFRLIRAALPALCKSGQGRVVNIASLSGKRVRNLNVGYQMSKFAVVALTHAVRRYGWEHGVRATAVCPGWVRTGLVPTGSAAPKQDMTDPDELAELIFAVACRSNTASVAELLVNSDYEHTL